MIEIESKYVFSFLVNNFCDFYVVLKINEIKNNFGKVVPPIGQRRFFFAATARIPDFSRDANAAKLVIF